MSKDLKLVWLNVHDGSRLEFSLDQELKIGRNKQNDIQIPDQLVSGSHCIIRHGKLIDARSTNGTQINDEFIQHGEPTELRVGDVVQFGDTKLYVEAGKPYSKELNNNKTTNESSESDSDENTEGTTKNISGLDWYENAPNPQNGTTDDNSDNVPPLVQKSDMEKRLNSLQKQVESLRKDNMRLRQQLNPMRLRQQKRKEKAKEEKLLTQIQDLQHQIFYGEEMRGIEEERLKIDNDAMKKELLSVNQHFENMKKKLEQAEELINRQREEVDTLRRQRDDRQKVVARLREEQLRLGEINSIFPNNSNNNNNGAINDNNNNSENLTIEVQILRENAQKLFLTVVLFLTTLLLMVFVTGMGHPTETREFFEKFLQAFGFNK